MLDLSSSSWDEMHRRDAHPTVSFLLLAPFLPYFSDCLKAAHRRNLVLFFCIIHDPKVQGR
jgi:hypothetical protein